MPEKVHKKFGDESKSSTPTNESAVSQSQNATKPVSSNGHDASKSPKTNGVKRFPDGTPKLSNGAPSTHEKDNGGRARTTSNASSNGKTNGVKGVNGAGAGKRNDSSSHGGASSNKKPKLNGGMNSDRPQHRQNQHDLQRIAKKLEQNRMKLPIWTKKADIRWYLRLNDVLLINGETGSGKSTQVPQFLCTEPWCERKKVTIKNKDGIDEDVNVGGMIAITQPRRVAAITLANRVGAEMGCAVSKFVETGKVGYSVRFDTVVPTGTKIKFVTEGTLLQEMLIDPNLRKYSCVIIDEIHERSVDVDLISGFLRQLVHSDKKGRGGIPLKVVIMSATYDLGGIESFFAKPGWQPDYKPGRNHGKVIAPHLLERLTAEKIAKNEVDEREIISENAKQMLQDEQAQTRRSSTDSSFSSWSGISDSPPGSQTNGVKVSGIQTNGIQKGKANGINSKDQPKLERPKSMAGVPEGDISENGVQDVYVRGRQYPVEIFYELTPTQDYLDNILRTIIHQNMREPLPGDFLVFLTGQEEIEALTSQLEHHMMTVNAKAKEQKIQVPGLQIMPLYGSLPAAAQQAVFEPVTAKFTRKIVLATNIAETSVTVPGVRTVIDCGKSKVKQFRPRLGMESLLAKPISKVSAIQRAGRAGREAAGKCFRVYTVEDFIKLVPDELPEILRSDVIEAVLKMKARGVDDVLSFPLMDSPDLIAMEKALLQLHVMNALDDEGKLTDAGKKMAQFPLPAAFGRVLIAAAEPQADCLLEAIDIISCLTTDSEVYLQAKNEEQNEAMEEHRNDIYRREGDVITLLTTMQRFASEPTDRNIWCEKRLISSRAMRMALNIRKQLRQVCPISPEKAEVVLKTFLKAFGTKTAVLSPDGSYSMTYGRHPIAIHPSSVLHGRKVEAIMFLDHVFTSKNYAKKVSAIQADWILEALEA
ncbi:P-loop containing nucleoside triphosphate hydrolase protein [Halenospora varia]|nr:P-loop containing nucleoside triphosphate hydrolase protein [Halenospora varia]